MTTDNPYDRVGRVAVGDHFVPRPKLAGKIQRAWRRQGGPPGNLSVIGHHRTGKTSLVHQAVSTCERTDLVSVILNVGSLGSGQELFKAMISEVLRATGSPPALEAIGGAALTATDWGDLRHTVEMFFKALADRETYALIVLDEFDRAATVCQSLAEFQLLRALASEPVYPVGLVTISRRRIITIETDAAGGSILDGVMNIRPFVGMFSPAEADVMLSRAAAVGVDLLGVRDDVLDLAGLHPYLLELLCQSIVDVHEETGTLDVALAYEQVLGIFDSQFDHLVQVVALDVGEAGSELLRSLAAGEAPTRNSLELNHFRQMGLVTEDRTRPALFSAEFARYVLAR
ncbi:hypothetical protein GCM10009527_014280 [Actinomadura nitritigenes]|uniref:ATP-binding protein n=1 Tax=Actinomadura nitritigenes TaxID=134602 RepID=A0ABS3RGT6_9ACTN|nr:ATP-binding protein [Actinomadura nitritigenes]MBO2445247.1 ATP-binding protein [Actinomadura nitritigenes]